MKNRKIILFTLLSVLFTICNTQTLLAQHPTGKPFATIYTDFYAGFNSEEYKTAFEVKRAYLGYSSQLNENFFAKVNLDIGSPNDQSQYALLRRYAYFKNAYVEYHKNKLTINFGIIPIHHFKLQEKTWAHRYIYKSINDEHGFGYTADLGTSAEYRISETISVDLAVTNGEGYTKLQSDDKYKFGVGVTGKLENGILFRAYSDISRENIFLTNISAFAGYNYSDKGAFGAEYNIRLNDDFKVKQQRVAISAYGTWNFTSLWQLFGRYDYIYGNIVGDDSIPWSLSEDGTAIIAGIQYSPIRAIKIALNYQDWYTKASNLGNQHYLFLNLEIKL